MRSLAMAMVLAVVAAQPAGAHDWYTGLRGPAGKLCCAVHDCEPRPVRMGPGGTEILIGGRWWPAEAPEWYMPEVMSPDGRWHGCMMPADTVPRCVIGPLRGV